MSKVFISSTGLDLADYREAAIETCNLLELIPIAMEYFESMGVGATKGSKHKLDDADLYVGIFAHRYGYIEKGQDLSVTEIEFDYAAERGLDRLCFLVKLDYPWPPDLIDYKNYALLHKLKNKINTSVVRNEFTTIDDFKAKLLHSLVKWQKKQEKNTKNYYPASSSLVTYSGTPPRPPIFIGRDNAMSDIKARLGISKNGKKNNLTIVRGLPGVGKTTLVKSLMYDQKVKEIFHDRILWASLGERANTATALLSWIKQYTSGEDFHHKNLDFLVEYCRHIFKDNNFLLIADDVWDHNHAIPCKQVMGENCALIVTTRFNNIARLLSTVSEDDIYTLNVLSIEKSVELLTRVAPFVVNKYPDQCRLLVQDLEGLPLVIRVAGRLLSEEANLAIDVIPLLNDLRKSNRLANELAPDDRFNTQTGLTPTINLLLKRSTDYLDEISRERFAKLGTVAPKPATFTQEAISKIWGGIDPLPTIRKLVNRGLLEPIVTQGVYQMHAVLVMHAKTLYKH